MNRYQTKFALAFLAAIFLSVSLANAQIQKSSPTGFMIEITCTVNTDAKTAYSKFVNDFQSWYDAAHSYSQKPENLSLDLKQHCMLETLDNGGFVRHMEIVFHQPGKKLRMTGGLGPLQGMGVSGSWTIAFEEKAAAEKDRKTEVKMTYIVCGAEFLQLDKIANPVNSVLGEQMTRFENWCNIGDPSPNTD